MPLFLKVTLVVAAGLLALILAAFVLKVVFIAAIVAAVGLGVLFVINFLRAFGRARLRLPAETSGPRS
jgi:hypothetical protein